ncbi:MAG: prephenate dehydrogenase [Acidobacteriota bacterium]
MASDPPFRTIGIAGLGLIGGSIALRARSTWPDVRLIGVDHDVVLRDAQAKQVIDDTRSSVSALGDADLIILAAPVPAVIDLIGAIANARLPAVVTDVGSTKRQIIAAARRAGLTRFVGGHPIAGSEHAGLGAAKPDLFVGRPWLFVDASPESADGRRLERFVTALGGVPAHLDAAAHDRAMAYLSHLPQLLAVTLMNTAAEACEGNALAASGRAFREMTRLASSPADLWNGILATNADFIAEAARALVARLPASGDQLTDAGGISRLFAQAKQGRERLDVASRATSDS